MGSDKYQKKRKRPNIYMLCIVFSAFLILYFLKNTHDTEEPYDTHNLNTPHKDNPRASITRKQLRNQRKNHSFSNRKQIKNQIDIGIAAACVPRRFDSFVQNVNINKEYKHMVRFVAIKFNCKNKKDIKFPNTIKGMKLDVYSSSKEFSRSTIRNELMQYVRQDSIYLSLDVDITIRNSAIDNILKVVRNGFVYFPIVWSMFSPKSIHEIESRDMWKMWTYSTYEGIWRKWGYGIYAITSEDIKYVNFDEHFIGWGGEDDNFFKTVQRNEHLKIVRFQDKGLIHRWHPKVCKKAEKHEMKACLGSKATYTSSNLGWMLMHEKRVHHDKILITIPTCLKYIQRLETILETWAKDIPNHIELLFFIAKSEIEEAKKMLPNAEFIAANISASEYPPVRRNIKMLETVYAEKNFDWILKVDDDSYVNIGNLQTLTYSFRTSSHAFLGSRGYGRPLDRYFLDLKKPFCMGGPGYLLRNSTLARVIPEFPNCLRDAENHTHKDKVWHSDVVISKCVTKVTKLGCWESDDESLIQYSNNVFKQHYMSAEPVYDTVTYHPLKTRDAMVQYHKSIL
jgi:hypothetical protein